MGEGSHGRITDMLRNNEWAMHQYPASARRLQSDESSVRAHPKKQNDSLCNTQIEGDWLEFDGIAAHLGEGIAHSADPADKIEMVDVFKRALVVTPLCGLHRHKAVVLAFLLEDNRPWQAEYAVDLSQRSASEARNDGSLEIAWPELRAIAIVLHFRVIGRLVVEACHLARC